MSVRLITNDQVESILTGEGCTRLENSDLETAEIWVTPTKKTFTVPVDGPKKMCDENTLRNILAFVASNRPINH